MQVKLLRVIQEKSLRPVGESRELPIDVRILSATHKNIAAWLDRIKALPGWKHPYDLMPGHPLPQ